ncbi:MAG: hypothetical protein PHR30_08510 [Gallionellaceae bacterium]|nr:hypothetical protein [Gallionellaceae bacterium]
MTTRKIISALYNHLNQADGAVTAAQVAILLTTLEQAAAAAPTMAVDEEILRDLSVPASNAMALLALPPEQRNDHGIATCAVRVLAHVYDAYPESRQAIDAAQPHMAAMLPAGA